MTPCIIMDIDGTLANAEHRLHLLPAKGTPEASEEERLKRDGQWKAFYDAAGEDAVNAEIRTLNNAMAAAGYPVWVLTGRSRRSEALTIDWLVRHQIHWTALMMREEGDHRPDTVVKKEMLDAMRTAGMEPIFAVEDRAGVTKM